MVVVEADDEVWPPIEEVTEMQTVEVPCWEITRMVPPGQINYVYSNPGSGRFGMGGMLFAKDLNQMMHSKNVKFGHISITFLPSAILSRHIRAIQTPNHPNMPKKYRGW